MKLTMNKQLSACALILSLFAALIVPVVLARAQGDNLLQNPGMESPYAGQGASNQTAPSGWRLWLQGAPVTAYPHVDPNQIHGGSAAWNINRGFEVFTAGGYQQVSGIKPGSIMRGSAFGLLYTCNNQATSCISNGARVSDRASGAYIKVGIDPSGGTDPNSPLINWSSNSAAFDNWTAVSVDATACNTSVTLFLYSTQALPMALNNVYWDDASLRVQQASTTSGAVTCSNPGVGTGGTGTVATVAAPTAAFAPFVARQKGEQEDGSIIHTMVAGDTLAAIAVAYGTTLDEIRKLNGFKPGEGGYLQIGQKIIVRGPTRSIPPTSDVVAVAALPTVTPIPGQSTPIAVAVVPANPVGATVPASPLFNTFNTLIIAAMRVWLTAAAAG